MNKNIIFLMLILVFSSFAFATSYPDVHLKFENNVNDETGNYTPTNNGITFTGTYPNFSISGSGASFSGFWDSARNDYVDVGSFTWANTGSVSMWINNELSANGDLFSLDRESGTRGPRISYSNGKPQVIVFLSSTPSLCQVTTNISDGTWHHVVMTWNGKDVRGYIDGTEECASGESGGISTGTQNLYIGSRKASGNEYYGNMDEFKYFHNTLTSTEVSNLYDCNDESGCVVNETVNESVESTAVVKQIGTVSTTGPTPVTVFSSDFEIIVNNTELYGAYSFNVQSTASTTLFCELEIDGSVVGNITRTQIPGVLGSVWLQSEFFSLETGTHTQELICRRTSGVGQININNAVGIGHFMLDENNQTIPHNETIFSTSTTGSDYNLLDELNFTISNRTTGGIYNVSKYLVVEWSGNYFNDDVSSEVLNTVVSIDDVNCSFYPRTVSSGGSGSVSGDCLLANATEGSHSVKFYGKGNNARFNIDLKVKEFILSPEEIAGGTVFPAPLNFTGLTRLFQLNDTGNINHAQTNVFEKIAFSLSANQTTNVIFYVKIINGSTFQTINFTRDLTTDIGVLIGHDILEEVTQDDYISELWAECGAGATCTIEGGDGIGYITDVTTTLFNAFEVRAFDNYNSSSQLLNFTVVNGGEITTTTGVVNFFTTDNFVNFTIVSEWNGGYFNTTYLNWNTSQDLNASMNQTLISWDCVEKVSGSNLNCTNPTESTVFNYDVFGNPHTQSVNVTSYFEYLETFNVSALQVETKTARMYSTNLTINSSSLLNNVTSCVYNVTGVTYPTFFESVSGSPLSSIGLINGTYSVIADCDGFAYGNENITIVNTTQNLDFVLFTVRSINFTFYEDINPNLLLSGVNISFAIVNGGASNYSTNIGYRYLDLLQPTDYEIRYTAPGYTDKTFFFTVTDRSTETLKLYLTNETETSQVLIQLVDLNDAPVSNTKIRLQQQSILMNGSYITVEECETNDDGECFMEILESTSIIYRSQVIQDGTLIKTTTPDKILFLLDQIKIFKIQVDLGENLIEELQKTLNVAGDITLNNETTTVTYTYSDGSNAIVEGCLVIKRRNIPGNFEVLSEVCGVAPSDTISVNYSQYIKNDTELLFEGIVKYSPGETVLDSVLIRNNYGVGENSLTNNETLLFTILVFVLISFATLLIPSLLIQIVVDFALMAGIVVLGLNLIGIPVIMIFMFIALVIHWDTKSARGGQL